MKQLNAKALTMENFKAFGSFTNMTKPDTPKIGDKPIEFFRDTIQLKFGKSNSPSISVCCIERRATVVDCIENHSYSAEGFMPLDGDVIVHLAPATANGEISLETFEAFIIPQYTFVAINPGVWHYAPFPITNEVVHTMVILPERSYANDCVVVKLEKKDYMIIKV